VIKIKCIILCAGYATRLYPLTKDKPKPLLPIAGKPMIEHILFRVEEVEDIDKIFVVTNNKFYSHFEDWSKNYKSNKKITIVNDNTTSNEDRLGAIGDIDFVVKHQNVDEELLVIAGDNLFEFSLVHLADFFKEKQASVVALYDLKEKHKAANMYGVVETDHTTKIIGFEEKPEQPKTSLISTACYVFTKKDLELLEKCIAEHHKPDNLGDFIKWLSGKEHVYGFVFEESWFDIGSHEQLKEVNEIYGER